MFRFSIRDLLWLTLAVALGLGWLVREFRLRAEADRMKTTLETAFETERQAAEAQMTAWRLRSRALKQLMEEDGWIVTWNKDKSTVSATWPRAGKEGSHEYLSKTSGISIRDLNPD